MAFCFAGFIEKLSHKGKLRMHENQCGAFQSIAH